MNPEDEILMLALLGLGGYFLLDQLAKNAGTTIPTFVKQGVQEATTTSLDQYTPDSIMCQLLGQYWCGANPGTGAGGTGPGTNTGTASGTTTGTTGPPPDPNQTINPITGCYPRGFVGPIPPGTRYCTTLEDLAGGIWNSL